MQPSGYTQSHPYSHAHSRQLSDVSRVRISNTLVVAPNCLRVNYALMLSIITISITITDYYYYYYYCYYYYHYY